MSSAAAISRRAAARRVLLLAANDVRLTTKDRSALLWMLLLPLAMMWLFGSTSSGGPGGPPKVSLIVDDRDGGWLARALADELGGDQLDLRRAEDEDAPKLETLVLPPGLTEGVLAGEAQQLRLEISPEAGRGPGMGARVHVWRAMGRVLGRLLELKASPAADPESGLTAAEAEALYARLAAAPPLVRLEVSTAGAGDPVVSGFAQSVPGMLTMTVLMMTLIYGGVFLISEKQAGMLKRQAGAPVSRAQILLGKLLGRLVIAALQLVVLLAAARLLFGLSLGRSPAGLALLLTGYAVAVAGLSLLLGAVFQSQEQVSSVGWILSMALAGLGGCWWPAEVMPEWLQTAAHALPTAWAMDGLHALISYGRGLEAVALPAAVLLAMGTLFVTLAARWLRLD